MYLIYKFVVITSILYISGSLGISRSWTTFQNGTNVFLNSTKPVVCGSHNCSKDQYCCGQFNSSCCNGLNNSTLSKNINSIRKIGNVFSNSTNPVVCGSRNCSQDQYCCGRYNRSCCYGLTNSTVSKNYGIFCNSTNFRMSASRYCSQGQYCCGFFNTTCCTKKDYPKKGVFCNSTNFRVSPSRYCSQGQYCCGIFNTTCCDKKDHSNKGMLRCNSTKPWLSPSRNCTRGQYCCGEYNTTCCNIGSGYSEAEGFWIAGLIVLFFIIAFFKALLNPRSGNEDTTLLINA